LSTDDAELLAGDNDYEGDINNFVGDNLVGFGLLVWVIIYRND
jgi:hypothetical protein